MLYEETTLPCQNVSCRTFSSWFADNPTLYLHHIEMSDAFFGNALKNGDERALILFTIPSQHHFIAMAVVSLLIKKRQKRSRNFHRLNAGVQQSFNLHFITV